MKKLFLTLTLLAPLAVAAQTTPKFGHINSQEIMTSMPEFIKARGEIEALSKQYENELKSMQDEYQRKAEEYEKNRSTMNETKQQETEEELNELASKIQQAYQDNYQELQNQQQEKMAPITEKLLTAIEAVGKNGDYVYVMDVAAGIPYISETLSINLNDAVRNELTKTSK